MSLWTKILIPVLVFGLVGIADAKPKKGASKNKGNSNSSKNQNSDEIKGTVSSVGGGSLILMSGGKKGSSTTITTDGNTKVSIDGKSVSLSDLQAGAYCTVTQKDGVAKVVKATTSSAGGKAKPGSKKKT